MNQVRYFWGFKTVFDKMGFYVDISLAFHPETRIPFQDSEDLENCLKKTKIISTYDVWGNYKINNNSLDFNSVAYDDEIVRGFEPDLQEGSWFDLNSDSKIVEAIVSANEYGLKVGDILSLNAGVTDMDDPDIQVKIIGILSDKTSVFGNSATGDINTDYRVCYENYDYKSEGQPLILMSKGNLKEAMHKAGNNALASPMSGSAMITFDDDITDIDSKYNEDYLAKNAQFLTQENLSVMKQNNYLYLKSQILKIFPLCICVFILTIMTAISVRAILAKLQMRTYAIYNLCGLSKSKCIRINLLSAAISCCISLGICIGGISIANYIGLMEQTLIRIGVWQMIVSMLLIFFILSVSSILSRFLINKIIPSDI